MKRMLRIVVYFGILVGLLLLSQMVRELFYKDVVAIEILLYDYYDQEIVKNALEKLNKMDIELEDDERIKKLLTIINESEALELRSYNRFYTKEEFEHLVDDSISQDEVSRILLREDYSYLKIGSFNKSDYIRLLKDNKERINRSEFLILDLRNNRGGFVDNYRYFMEYFIDRNEIILKLQSANEIVESYATTKQSIAVENIIILVNEQTASVSELMTMTFNSKYENCVIVGEKTYGKYFAYAILKFVDDSRMTYVSSIMLDPFDNRIPVNGIEPEIELTDETGKTSQYLQHVIKEVRAYLD